MCFGSVNSGAVNQLQQQQQQALTSGSQAIQKAYSGFTPQFYQNYQNQYLNQATPQLMSQYRQTGQNLNYSLANKGLLQSSAAQQAGGALQSQLAAGQQGLVNNAQQASQQLQQSVAGQQAQLYSQLANTYNPTAAAQSAAQQAAVTAAPSTFQPIGQMFQNFANQYLGNQNASAANQQAQWLYPYLIQQSYQPSTGYLPS